MPRQLNGVDLAIWRSVSGSVQAWGDRCPHRGMRLSHGFVRGETLACIYHGWQYDHAGICGYIPAHPKLDPPKTIQAQRYACRVVSGLIWVALTDTEAAPPDTAPYLPVRTLDIALPLPVLAARLGCDIAPVVPLGPPFELMLALHPRNPDSCLIHALAQDGSDPVAVSRHLEALRADLEKVAA